MQKITLFRARAMLLSAMLVLLLAACDGETPQPTPAVANPTTDAIPVTPAVVNPTTDASPAPTATTPAVPTTEPTVEPTNTVSPLALDLSSLNVCTFVPREVIEGIIGPLKDEGTPDTVLGKEKGCTFYSEDGNFADIRIYPPNNWELQKGLEADKIIISDLGSEGFVVNKSDAYEVWVLARDVAVVQVRVSSHSGAQARQIAEAVLALLP
jgi:hypothetical protein